MRRTRAALSLIAALNMAGTCLAWLGSGGEAVAPGVLRLLAVSRPLGAPLSAGWREASRIVIPGRIVVMQSVAVVAADDAWAAGFAAARGRPGGRLVLGHWSGQTWRLVTLPRAAVAAFDRLPAGYRVPPAPMVAASTAPNVWVFNQMTGGWLRWDGRRWSHGLLPRQHGWADVAITSGLVRGRNDVWAFGSWTTHQGDSYPYAARFNGTRWTMTPIPRVLDSGVSAAAAAGSGGVWAVIGGSGQLFFPPVPSGGKLVRWDGRRWQFHPLAAMFTRLGDPASVWTSPGGLWVAGGIAGKALDLTEAAARWNGSAWETIKVPAPRDRAECVFRAVIRLPGGLMGLGDCFSDANPGQVWSRLWRLSAGRWTGPALPRMAGRAPVFLDLAGARRAGSAWAVGFSGSAGIVALYGPRPR